MFVRSAKEEDLDGLYDLCCEQAARVLPRDVFEAVFRAAAKDAHRRLVVATEDEQIVGYADMQLSLLLSHCALAAVFNEFYVREALRGHGIGTGMLLSLSRQAQSIGCGELQAFCQRVNLKSQSFLERHGFVRSQHNFTKSIEPAQNSTAV